MLAGVGAGVFGSVDQAARQLPRGRTVTPRGDPAERAERRERWRTFVRASAGL
jgi:glycerol kinase